jgi:hypothetical protein
MDNRQIELEALICEREAMLEENSVRERQGFAHAWPGSCFNELAEQIRALKTVEAKPEQPTTPAGVPETQSKLEDCF